MMDRNFIIRDSRFIILTRRAIRDCECRVVSVVLVMSQPTRYAAAAVAAVAVHGCQQNSIFRVSLFSSFQAYLVQLLFFPLSSLLEP